ncbi:DSD1 family PLP-dependent enzyme [Hoeflea sp. WL0058]|uniref:DSD1 family PLP-dependent enzyme n=1 Tax=Flavimaribacter sediminis TaxID=2865987 RepID=A0AAE3D2S7_9HYPH|nr:DSD1 family PLP-dependent enzyme [Flavimaribacter sediminis]MBW8639472.1 DSD1 family PLP-dependent enzyme [Flavimaribacter sediminis]
MGNTAEDLGPNQRLIGIEGSRAQLATPSLVIDLDVMERNMRTMADIFSGRPQNLRPHAKTHKCATIAKKQIELGALGVCCAKPGEAIRLAEAGVPSLLLTSPVVDAYKVRRLVGLLPDLKELIFAVDSRLAVDLISAAATEAGVDVPVIVDIGIGNNRTGARDTAAAVDLGKYITSKPGVTLSGIQCYAGYVQHIENPEKRAFEAKRSLKGIGDTKAAMFEAFGELPISSGSGTGSYDIDLEADVFNEYQVGSYIFMDVEYNAVTRPDQTAGPFATSLFVQTTVISANVEGRATTDAGYKSFAMDGPSPKVFSGASRETEYKFLGDEHGWVHLPAGEKDLTAGDVLTCVTPHCDPTVNLYDFYHIVRGDTLVDIWPIEARGCSW